MKNEIGKWRPSTLSSLDVKIITVFLAMQAFIRAYDYGTLINREPLAVVEKAFPLWAWSTALAVCGLTMLTGVIAKNHYAVWLGHATLGILYLTLFFGTFIAILGMPNLDGIRGPGSMSITVVLHFLLAARTGPWPIGHEISTPTADER